MVAVALVVTALVYQVVAVAVAETAEDPVLEILLQQFLLKVSLEVLEVQDKQDHLVTQELAAVELAQREHFRVPVVQV
jgi:hypothetical protein